MRGGKKRAIGRLVAGGNILAVVQQEGAYWAFPPKESPIPIRKGGQTVTEFSPGWRPTHIYTGFKEVYLLELRNIDGASATWFLNRKFEFVENCLSRLPRELLDRVVTVATSEIKGLWEGLVVKPKVSITAAGREILRLSKEVRDALIEYCWSELDIASDVVAIGENSREVTCSGAENLEFRGVGLRSEALKNYLSDDILQSLISCFSRKVVQMPSLLGERTRASDTSFVISEFLQMYRFTEPKAKVTAYAIVTNHKATLSGVFIPSMRLFVTSSTERASLIKSGHGSDVEELLLRHIMEYGEALIQYIGRSTRRPVAVYRENHIGHHLWNELTGIQKIVNETAPEDLPEVIMLSAAHSEMYGGVESIFPELEGKVNRRLDTAPDLARYCYREGLMALRPTSDFISEQVRARVYNLVSNEEIVKTASERLRSSGYDSCPVVLLGLRVENRTLVDLEEFCGRVITYLQARCGKVVVVVDGHNVAGGNGKEAYRSHWEHVAKRSPSDVEKELCKRLNSRFDDGNVMVVDNVLCSVHESLWWARRSDFIISLWGAGLAKYRWMGNKTGIVLTNRWNLLHRDDLQIYGSPKYMEDPSALYYVSAVAVSDVESSDQLLNLPGESYHNFVVDLGAVFVLIDKCLSAWSAVDVGETAESGLSDTADQRTVALHE